MVVKDYISSDDMRDNTLKVAWKLYKEKKFVPDVIYASLRGGALLANVFSEFYKLVCKKENRKPAKYAAVECTSREALIPGEESEIVVNGWTILPSELESDSKILLVDDIFDTGNTVNEIVRILLENGLKRENIVVFVYDYKVRNYSSIQRSFFQPDIYCRKFVLNSPEDDNIWFHYMSHEFVGLKPEEIDAKYSDSEVRSILKEICK